jgi:protein-disulfide isomerase
MDMNEEPGSGLESQPEETKKEKSPIMVINIYSWMTPVLAVVMLIIGLLVGYFIHPLPAAQVAVVAPTSAVTPTSAVAAVQPPAQIPQPPVQQQAQPTMDPAVLKQIVANLVSKTRHFKGSPNAPVTMLEFSDFQ